MREIVKKVYTFDELDKTAKEKAKQDYYEAVGTDDNNDQFQESANEILSMIGFADSKVSYSLSYCQGDGLTFSFKLYPDDIVKLLKLYQDIDHPIEQGYQLLEELQSKLYEVVKDVTIPEDYIEDNEIMIYAEGKNNRYCHKYTKNIEIDFNEESNSDSTNDLLRTTFENIYYTVCDFLEKLGYEMIYEVMTDEEYAELSDANNYEYFEDGTLM